MKTLICTVGLPRSGKTTWARKQGIPIVSPDAIRLAITDRAFVPRAEPIVWATAQTMVRALFIAGHNRVILDATNNTRKRRDVWISNEWSTCWKVIYEDVETCALRAVKTDREDIIPIIEKMAEEHERLHDDELENTWVDDDTIERLGKT
jgi:predicted kinase